MCSYISKGGEDTRVDMRVQQLFETMNAVAAADAGMGLCGRGGTGLRVMESGGEDPPALAQFSVKSQLYLDGAHLISLKVVGN